MSTQKKTTCKKQAEDELSIWPYQVQGGKYVKILQKFVKNLREEDAANSNGNQKLFFAGTEKNIRTYPRKKQQSLAGKPTIKKATKKTNPNCPKAQKKRLPALCSTQTLRTWAPLRWQLSMNEILNRRH